METKQVYNFSYGVAIAEVEIPVTYQNNKNRKIEGWMIDNFSTILSRKHSFHKRVGKIQFVKVKKENY